MLKILRQNERHTEAAQVHADVVFEVGGPDGTFAVAQVDQGEQVLTSQRRSLILRSG